MLYREQTYTHYQSLFDWGDAFPSAIRVRGQVTLDMIQEALSNPESGLPTIGIPVTYERDQIQSGGMFNKQVEDCLLMKNAAHPNDYFKFVFTVRTTGAMTTIGVYHCGESGYMGKANEKEFRQKSDFFLDRVRGFLTQTDHQGIQAEDDYYQMVFGVLKGVFGI